MADQLFLSLWYPNFRTAALPAALLGVIRQLQLIGAAPGESPLVHAANTYPISWSETPIFSRIYDFTDAIDESDVARPEIAIPEATERLHDDFAYEFEVPWELWLPEGGDGFDTLWRKGASVLKITGFGPEFDDGSYEINGQIRIGFGLDTPFLQEDVELDREATARVQENIVQLLTFVRSIEKNCGISTRLLWSESGESLAEKLIARLQQVN